MAFGGTTSDVAGPAPAATGDRSLRLLADTPISSREEDYFGYWAHADAVAEIIDSEHTDTPLTIAVTGPWGSGKTSLARMVQSRLEEWTALRHGGRRMTVCRFEAWMHDDAPHLGAALAASVARKANEDRPWWRKVQSPLPEALLSQRERWRRRAELLVGLLVLAAVLAALPPTREAAHDVALPKAAGGSVAILLFVAVILWRKMFGAAQEAVRFVQAPEAEAAIGALGLAREQLGELIDSARLDGRFVIFVDDLERCEPPRAVEVCEVASQLLAHEGVVTVLLADMDVIAASAEMKYKDVAAGKAGQIGRDYLEKLVQVQLELPPARPEDMRALLRRDAPVMKTKVEDRAAPPSATQGDAEPRWLLVAASAPLVGGAVLALGALVGNAIVAALGAGLVVAALAVRLGADAVQRRRVRRRMDLQQEIDNKIQEVAGRRNALTEIEKQVLEDGQFEKASDLVRKQVDTYLTEQSNEVKQVEAVITQYPPALPRSAKRMLNHARLLTRIARDRDLFVGDLTAAHLGKWIVLNERWRSVAEAVTRDEELMARLEAAAAADGGPPAAVAEQAGIAGDAAWSEVKPLLASRPPLRDVVQRLVRLDPGKAPPDPEQASPPAYAAHEP